MYVRARMQKAPILPGRFVDFGRLAWSLYPDKAHDALEALEQAQALTVGDADPLVTAITGYADQLVGKARTWSGTPTKLIDDLRSYGADIPRQGGKGIANRLRDAKDSLELFGLSLTEKQQGNNAIFKIQNC